MVGHLIQSKKLMFPVGTQHTIVLGVRGFSELQGSTRRGGETGIRKPGSHHASPQESGEQVLLKEMSLLASEQLWPH